MRPPLHPKAIAKLLQVRADAGLTQRQFADLCPVNESTIKHAENGAPLRHTTLVRIAHGISTLLAGDIEISAQDLIDGTIPFPPQAAWTRRAPVPDHTHDRQTTHPVADIVARLLTPYLNSDKTAAIVAECVLATSAGRSGSLPQTYGHWNRAAEQIRRRNNAPRPRPEFVIAELEFRLECLSTLHLSEERDEIRRTAFRIQYLFEKPCVLPQYLGARFLSELAVQCHDCGKADLATALSEKAHDLRGFEATNFPERARFVGNVVARRHAHIIMAESPVEAGVRLTELRTQWSEEGNSHGVAAAAFSTLCGSRIHDPYRKTLRLLERFRSELNSGGPFVDAMSLALESALVDEDGRTQESKELAKDACRKLKQSKRHAPTTANERERLIYRPDRILGSEQIDVVGESPFTRDEINGFVKSVVG